MIFRTLAENLIRDPNNLITVQSLIRELENDLIAAFQISQPLVNKNRELFWQSTSFLDFLIRISKLPSFKDCLLPQESVYKSECDVFRNKSIELEKSLKKQLEDNEQLLSELKICQSRLMTSNEKLQNCQLDIKLGQEKNNALLDDSCEEEEEEEISKNYEWQKRLNEQIIKNTDLQHKIDMLTSKLELCQFTENKLQHENMSLQEDLKLCKQTILTLEQKNEELTETISRLTCNFHNRMGENIQRYKKLFNSYKEFADHNKNTIEINHQLIAQIQKLESEKSEMKQIGRQLLEEHNQLVQRNIHLEKQYNDFKEDSIVDMDTESIVECIDKDSEMKCIDPKFTDLKEKKNISVKKFNPEDNVIEDSNENDDDDDVKEILDYSNKLKNILEETYTVTDALDWQTNAFFHLEQDLNLAKIFKEQLEKLKQKAEFIQVTPETFADSVLNLHQNTSQYYQSLEAIAKVMSITCLDDVVEQVTFRVGLINRIYKPFSNITFTKWSETFPQEIEQLATHFTEIKDWISLHEECLKLALKFEINLNPNSFSNDILNSQRLTEFETLKKDIFNFFEKSPIESFREYIENILQISVTEKTFKEQIEVYNNHIRQTINAAFEKVIKEKEDQIQAWDQFYVTLLPQLNFDPKNITREVFATKVISIKNENDQWNLYYQKWLEIFKMESTTSAEVFTQRLKTPKRSHSTKDEFEKKPRAEIYSFIEIQNLFNALYKEFFKLKWNHFNETFPRDTEVVSNLSDKLEFIQEIEQTRRESELLTILLKYVKLDLVVFREKQQPFSEIVSIHELLNTTLKTTEEYLKNLLDKEKNKAHKKMLE